jgi:peptide/nickel transport system ATP-binding protein
MADPILRVKNLTVDLPPSADRRYAIENVSFDIARNEILCLVGESGSGKSVTGRAIMGLLQRAQLSVSQGHILLSGEDLTKASDARMREVRGADISMIFQEPMTALNPVMRVGRQIDELLRRHRRMTASLRKRKILDLLAAVALPDPDRIYHAYPHQVSGGQRQRVVIAMALILEPALIIADEPTTALDVTTQGQILKLIKEMQSIHRSALLFITHDFGIVAEIADRVAVIQDGCLLELGAKSDVLRNPQHPYTQRLIDAVPSLTPPASRATHDAPVVLSVRGLDKTYWRTSSLFGRGTDGMLAVQDVTFDLRRGEILGIVGESGSGKSTLARCVMRLIDASGGEIWMDGVELRRLSRRQMRGLRKNIQMVFQDPYGSLNPRRTVGQLIAQGPIVQGETVAAALRKARELLNSVGLDAKSADRYPHEFSGGQRQRIGIARALAVRPTILVADEAVSALDVSVQAQVLKLLKGLRDQFDLAMLFVTHDLRVAAQLCDRIAVMRFGQIIEQGATADLFASPKHPYTRELLDAVPGRAWFATSSPGDRSDLTA